MKRWNAVVAAALVLTMHQDGMTQNHVRVADAGQGMVVSETSLASGIGQRMLARGGNAVDAAIATAFALAVTWPEAGNIGGGGFMMIRSPDGEAVCIDYRETAPAAAREDTFQPGDGYLTRKVVGVPGTVRGLGLAHQRYAKLPWRGLVLPAAHLARDGFPVDRYLASSVNHVLSVVGEESRFAELKRVYGKPGGGNWQAGDVMRLPDLAKTLMRIAEHGPDAFYQGPLARSLVEEMERGQGIIREADLDAYRAVVRAPVRGTFRGYEVLGAPPPSSGGTCLIESLNIIEALEVNPAERFSAETIHLIAEASRRAFLDRARYLGDPGFVKIPAKLLTKKYARKLAGEIERQQASSSAALAPEIKLADESPDTTHFSVVDGEGMAVSNTYTLEASWGSRIVVQGAGYLLNNEMGDFNWFPGVTTRYGRIGTLPNVVAPKKRMLSSQCPVIVCKEGKVALVTGSPGGRTIINTVLGVVLNVTCFGMDAAAAVRAPRMHHQWFPDRIQLERLDRPPHLQVVKDLKQMGHQVVNRSSQGSAHTIWWDPESKQYVGIADFRRGGRPMGYAADRRLAWNFDDHQGTSLAEARQEVAVGSAWSQNLPGGTVDGAGHYRMRGTIGAKPQEAQVDLRAAGLETASVRVHLDALRPVGKDNVPATQETRLQVTLTDDSSKPQTIAGWSIERSAEGALLLRAMPAASSEPTEPYALSADGLLGDPVTLRLDVDTKTRRWQLEIRRRSTTQWTRVAAGTIGAKQAIGYLRLATTLDRRTEIDIDRIEVRGAATLPGQ